MHYAARAMIFAFTTFVKNTPLYGKIASKVWKIYFIYFDLWLLLLSNSFLFSALMSHLPLLLLHIAMLCEKQDKASMSIEYKQSNINGIMAMCHECGQESAADDVISCHFLLTSNLVTSNYSTALNCQTNKQRAEQRKRIYKEQFARIAYFSALNYGPFNRSH